MGGPTLSTMSTVPMTFFLLSLYGGSVGSEVHIVQAVLGSNCSLPCPAGLKPGVQYLFVSWHKLYGDPAEPQRRGLVTRDLPDGLATRYKGQKREVVLEYLTNNVMLPNVTCSDDGLYSCRLYAPVGERNLDVKVLLDISDCQDTKDINIPNGPVKINTRVIFDSKVIISASAVMILAVFGSLAINCKSQKLSWDQKKSWKRVTESLDKI